MDADLRALIDSEKEEIKREQALAQIPFEKKEVAIVPEKKEEKPIVESLIEQSLGAAIQHRVMNDDKVQERLLDTADRVIDNAMNAEESKAELADKEAYFNNKKGACECWGYDEATTDKTFVKAMAFVHNIFTAIWIIIGSVTFAPIVFVAKKLQVIVKKTWIAVLIALLIYLIVILTPTLLSVLK